MPAWIATVATPGCPNQTQVVEPVGRPDQRGPRAIGRVGDAGAIAARTEAEFARQDAT